MCFLKEKGNIMKNQSSTPELKYPIISVDTLPHTLHQQPLSDNTNTTQTNNTTSRLQNPWIKTLMAPTEAEITAIKEARRNELIGELVPYVHDIEKSEIIVDKMINDHVIHAFVKVIKEDGTAEHLVNIIMQTKTTKLADIIEPLKGNDTATISHSCYFDAIYTSSLRGGETYSVTYNYNMMAQILNIISDEPLSRKLLVKALIQNIVLSGLSSSETILLEKIMIRNAFLKPQNTFIADIEKAKNELKMVETINDVAYDEEEQALEVMKDYAVLNKNGSIKIIDTTKQGLTVSSVGELKTLFANHELLCLDQVSGKMKMVNPVDIWMKSKKRREYYGTKFDPSNKTDDQAYNLFKGFKYEAKPLIDITLFKDFVKEVICSGEEEMYNIVWTFLAQMVQDPTRKMGTALVLLSAKGTGKSSFLKAIGKLMENYFMQTAENKRLLGEFNAHLSSTLLFYANELTFLDNKRVISKLKNVITEESFTYELKGGATYTDPNYTRIIIDSNEDKVVVQTADERRFIYPIISEARIGDTGYFNKLYALFKEEGFYESLMYDLMNFDYSKWEHFLKTPPKNVVSEEQMMESFNDIESWWLYCLEEGRIPHAYYEVTYDDRLNIANEALYKSFRKYTTENGRRVKLDSTTFGKAFKKYALGKDLCLEKKGKITINGVRKNSHIYEVRSKCVNYFVNTKKLNNFDYDGKEWEDCTIIA